MRTLLLSIAVLAAMSCNSYRTIYIDYDRSVDFSLYHTFAWVPDSADRGQRGDDTGFDIDIVRNNAKNYITNNLTMRGMLVNVDSPDVVFQLVLLNEKMEKVISYTTYPGMRYYYYSPFYFPYYYPNYRFYTWYGWNYPFWDHETTTYTNTYMKGTITINMYDRVLKRLVWSASAEGDIYDPSYIHYHVHPAIDRIMKKFPVKPSQAPKYVEPPKGKIPIVRINHGGGMFDSGNTH